jgi:hypothetical protein
MEIYLDDCSDADLLIALLTRTGHRVATPRSEGTLGLRDDRHLDYAARSGFVLLSKNPRDFRALHTRWQAQGRPHAGILLVYLDNIKGKDMGPADIVRAIDNLVASGLPIANEIHVLNHWR